MEGPVEKPNSPEADNIVSCDRQSSTMGGSGLPRIQSCASTGSGRSNQDCAAKNSRNAARIPFLTEYAANFPSSFARSTAVNSAAIADVIIAVQSVAAHKAYLRMNGSSRFDKL